MNALDDLKRRGLVKATTGDLSELFSKPVTFYVGFDPTADSLHVGHLLAVTTIKRLAQAGHTALVLIGDATAAIGDPSGKRDARPMLLPELIEVKARSVESQIMRLLREETEAGQVKFVRNLKWFSGLGFLDFMREIGSEFSVNVMLRAECFKARLEDGLSFLELSYMLMQGFDFLHLFLRHECVLQVGGDDQWSNILAGVDLIRRKRDGKAWGMTLPLLENTDGTKMGKTVAGAVWLAPDRTSAFEFFQFWRNVSDDKVFEMFKRLTFVSMDEIVEMENDAIQARVESPITDYPRTINNAKKLLACELTKFVHGEEAAARALRQAEDYFEAQDASTARTVTIVGGATVVDALVISGLAKSRTDARHLVEGKGVYLNEAVVEDPYLKVVGSEAVLRKGKKTFVRLRVT